MTTPVVHHSPWTDVGSPDVRGADDVTAPRRHLCATVAFKDPQGGAVMLEIITVGLDLAKNVFRVHGADGAGRAVLREEQRQAL